MGSGQQYTQPLVWRKTATGGLSAASSFQVPPAAQAGRVRRGTARRGRSGPQLSSGQFRVEEFRLPVLEGRVTPSGKTALVNVKAVPAEVQVNYVAGGPAANLPVRVSALVRGKSLSFPRLRGVQLPAAARQARDGGSEGEEEATATQDTRVIADKLPLTLDRNGAGKLTIEHRARPRRSRRNCCWRPPTPTRMARCRRSAAPPPCGRPA